MTSMMSLDDSRVVIGATLLTLGTTSIRKTRSSWLRPKRSCLGWPGLKLYDSDSPKSALIAGDVDLGITWTGEAFLAAKEKPALNSRIRPKARLCGRITMPCPRMRRIPMRPMPG